MLCGQHQLSGQLELNCHPVQRPQCMSTCTQGITNTQYNQHSVFYSVCNRCEFNIVQGMIIISPISSFNTCMFLSNRRYASSLRRNFFQQTAFLACSRLSRSLVCTQSITEFSVFEQYTPHSRLKSVNTVASPDELCHYIRAGRICPVKLFFMKMRVCVV